MRCARIARVCFERISVVFAPRRAHSGFKPSMTWKKCTIYLFSARTLVFRGSVSFFRPFPCHPPYTREVGGSIRQLEILAKFALTKVLPAQVARAARSWATSQMARRVEHAPRRGIVKRMLRYRPEGHFRSLSCKTRILILIDAAPWHNKQCGVWCAS